MLPTTATAYVGPPIWPSSSTLCVGVMLGLGLGVADGVGVFVGVSVWNIVCVRVGVEVRVASLVDWKLKNETSAISLSLTVDDSIRVFLRKRKSNAWLNPQTEVAVGTNDDARNTL